jgi:hypothetical protein
MVRGVQHQLAAGSPPAARHRCTLALRPSHTLWQRHDEPDHAPTSADTAATWEGVARRAAALTSVFNRRQLRWQDAKAFFKRHALARELVVGREARRVRRLGGLPLGVCLLHHTPPWPRGWHCAYLTAQQNRTCCYPIAPAWWLSRPRGVAACHACLQTGCLQLKRASGSHTDCWWRSPICCNMTLAAHKGRGPAAVQGRPNAVGR